MAQSWGRNWNVVEKTASYTVTDADKDTLFTNRGDTDAITFTLPDPSTANKGNSYRFLAVVDAALAVATTTADKMIVARSGTATSVKWGTSGEIIGNGFDCISDGTSWLTFSLIGNPAETIPTVA